MTLATPGRFATCAPAFFGGLATMPGCSRGGVAEGDEAVARRTWQLAPLSCASGVTLPCHRRCGGRCRQPSHGGRACAYAPAAALVPRSGLWHLVHHEFRDGMMVPTPAQVAWLRPEGRRPYLIGKLTSLAYEGSP